MILLKANKYLPSNLEETMKHKGLKNFDLFFFAAGLILILFSVLIARAQQNGETPNLVSSGGAFTLEKTVVAGGGNQMTQQQLNLSGTTGQPIAGYRSTGGNFSVYSGFWTPEDFVPTAASVTVGGRVKTAEGKGIRNVIVTITFPSGEQRTVLSGTFGYYRFAEIPAGESYVFSAAAKRYTFSQPTQIRNITDDTQDIDFIAYSSLTPIAGIEPQ
jgi:hypothetical protein